MRRDAAFVAVLWLLATLVGWALTTVEVQPPALADKAELIDHAFRVLLFLAVPVFTFVVVVLVYSVVRFRRRGEPDGDGLAIEGRGRVPLVWLVITSALTLLVMVYPGLTELPKIIARDPDPDVVVEVEGLQWAWRVGYPQHGIEVLDELVLPVDRSVTFEITSADVLHSVWIPAFRMKMDAVPGLTTSMSLTPTELVDDTKDPRSRLQCAEMCGIDHSTMVLPVRVVDDATFASWVNAKRSPEPAQPSIDPGAQRLEIAAQNPSGTTSYVFTTGRLTARAGTGVVVTFRNDDVGVPHNFALFTTDESSLIAMSQLENGPVVQTIVIPPLEPGAYPFLCLAHTTTMKGTLEVE